MTRILHPIASDTLKNLPSSYLHIGTGFENTDCGLLIDGVWVRRNQYHQAHSVYDNYEQRLRNVASLGIEWLRYGQGWSFSNPSQGVYDFEIDRKIVDFCKSNGIIPYHIHDLVHFGVPDWVKGHFQNPDSPHHLAEYAKARALAFPEIRFFTPVNELHMARWSAFDGKWNEQLTDYRLFIRALFHQAKATILARAAIEEVWIAKKRKGKPVFFYNEALQAHWSRTRASKEDEHILERFASFDLVLGHRDPIVKAYLLKHGITEDEYNWCMTNGSPVRAVVGIDFYPQKHPWPKGHELQKFTERHLTKIINALYRRYPECVQKHMEVNSLPCDAKSIWTGTLRAVLAAKQKGIPIVGLTWFGDEYQTGWRSYMKEEEICPVGLFHEGVRQEPICTLVEDAIAKYQFVPHS